MGGDRRASHPSEISDEDSISLTSTISSAKEENNEYVVEGILAERDDDGVTKYLARWEGYPDERCTWEIRSHFTDVTLLDWETQKMRVARGYAESYDVEALLDRVKAWISAAKQRKSRRRAKRLRLGLPVAPIEETISDGDDSYEEVEEISSDEEDEQESPASDISTESKGVTLSDSRRQSSSKENPLSSSRPTAPVAKMARNQTEEEISGNLNDAPGAQPTAPNRTQGPGKAPTAVMFRPQKRDSDSAGSKSLSVSSDTSPTEISFGQAGNGRRDQASGLPKKRLGAAKSSPTTSKVGIDGIGSLSKNHSPETEQASKLSSASSPKHALSARRRSSLAETDSLRKLRKEPPPPDPVSPAIQNPGRGSLPQPRSKSSSKSSKIPRKSTKVSPGNSTGTKQTQIGSGSRGPARLSLPQRKSTAISSKKVRVAGAAVLSNWNKAPKRRKSNAFQPGSSDKPSHKFSIVRKYEKRGRNEPAPNIEQLTFIDLKRGGVAKKSSSAIPKISPPKTPYQLIQEGLKADANASSPIRSSNKSSAAPSLENKRRLADLPKLTTGQSANSEIADLNSTSADPIPVPASEEPTSPVPNAKKQIPSVSQDHPAQKLTSRRSVSNPISTEEVRISVALPTEETPTTHDALVIPTALQNKRDLSNAHQGSNTSAPLQDKSAFTAQPAAWSKAGMFHSRSYTPTQTSLKIPYGPTTLAQRNRVTKAQMELMHSGVENDILGNILIEQDCKDLGDLRFRGMDRSARQLFLTIKVPPRQVHVICKNICTIGEYQEFYRGVGVVSCVP